MTDLATGLLDAGATVHKTDASRARLAKRYAAERRFKALGLAAVLTAGAFLVFLLSTIVTQAIPAFTQSYVALPLNLAGEGIDRNDLAGSNYSDVVRDALSEALPFASGRSERRTLRGLLASSADITLRRDVLADPALVGGTHAIGLPLDDVADLYLKGLTGGREDVPVQGAAAPSGTQGDIRITAPGAFADLLGPDGGARKLGSGDPSYLLSLGGGVVKLTSADAQGADGAVLVPLASAAPVAPGDWSLARFEPEAERQIDDRSIAYLDALKEKGLIERRFNSIFFTHGASREPEMAGVLGAVVGSLLTMMVTLALAFPIGVASAIYLEEFAPKNRWTNLIEVNINNLAAVPSIVYGLLGLAVFLNVFGLPRSSALIGGMVLALMTLPIIIIASRAALKAVPPSIREAALGVGASRLQTVFHHVLPLALPGMLTGTIIGMAQALGETAPLLMIGMVAFIVDTPNSVLEPATLLPVQIYMWADFPEPAFQQKTSAAILVLLAFLITMNALAIVLRRRFERRW